MPNKRKRSVILFLCLVFAAGLFSACSAGGGQGGPTPTPMPAIVSYEKAIFTVKRGKIVSEKELLGEIVPIKQDELFFRTSGYAVRVSVKSGDLVKKGDILAEQQIDDLLNQLQQAEIDLEVAKADLTKYNAQRQYEIEKAKADVYIWEKRVALSMIAVDDAYGEWKVKAQLNLDIDAQNLELAEQNLKMINEDNSLYNEQTVKRTQLAVDRLKGLLAERQIVAPYDCIILRASIRPGTQVDAFLPAFVVGDPAELVVRSSFDTDLSNKLSKETEARLYLNKDDEKSFPITFLPNFLPVSSVDKPETAVSSLGASNSDYIYFNLPKELDRTKTQVGQKVNLTVVLGRKDDVLLLSPAAIREYRGLSFVIVQDGDRRRRVEINEIGLKSTDLWEVNGDLREGDQVLGP
jgi:multidrug efflux pump subunit AcrA (membrane-fusion protein)